ncbi:MAG: hypothetical protein ACRCWJ_18795 [Casimicrobium sp.]
MSNAILLPIEKSGKRIDLECGVVYDLNHALPIPENAHSAYVFLSGDDESTVYITVDGSKPSKENGFLLVCTDQRQASVQFDYGKKLSLVQFVFESLAKTANIQIVFFELATIIRGGD